MWRGELFLVLCWMKKIKLMLLKCMNYNEAKLMFDAINASIRQMKSEYRSLETLSENSFIKHSIDWLRLWYNNWSEDELHDICETSIVLSCFELKYFLYLEESFISTLVKTGDSNEYLALLGFIDSLWEYNNKYALSCDDVFLHFHSNYDMFSGFDDIEPRPSVRKFVMTGFINQLPKNLNFERIEPHDIVYKYMLRGLKVLAEQDGKDLSNNSESAECYYRYINEKLLVDFINTYEEEFPEKSFQELYLSFLNIMVTFIIDLRI